MPVAIPPRNSVTSASIAICIDRHTPSPAEPSDAFGQLSIGARRVVYLQHGHARWVILAETRVWVPFSACKALLLARLREKPTPAVHLHRGRDGTSPMSGPPKLV